ncbi:MAG: cyclophilin-like fold protein [Burkholderiaceae bacterium]
MSIPVIRAASRRAMLILKLLSLLGLSGIAAADNQNGQATAQPSNAAMRSQVTSMKIQITLAGAIIASATLDDNDSAKDLAALLPLNLPLKDYAATEKITTLPRKLSMQDAPSAYTPSAGDISFYAPWGNLAIFYKDGHLSSGLVRLGRIDSGLDALKQLGQVSIRIERATP